MKHRVITPVLSLVLALLVLPGAPWSARGLARLQEEEKAAEKKPPEKAEEEKEEEKKEEEEEKDTYLAVTGGTIHTVTGGVLRGATLLAKNGKIQRIGHGIDIPEEADTLDASGLNVYPGLIACNSRGLIGSEPPQQNSDVFALNLILGLSSGITTVVTGNTAAKLTYGTLDGLLLKSNLFVRVSTRNADAWRKLRTELDKIRDHHRKKLEYERKKAAGDEVEEPKPKGLKAQYVKLMEGQAVARFDANAAHELRRIARLASEYGFKAVVYGAREGWVAAEELGRAGIACVVSARTTRQRDPARNRPHGARPENPAILHRHGVPIAVNPARTGISLGGLVGQDLFTLPIEAAYAVRGGMSQQAALESITITAARVLGVDDQVGSLEVGKDCDLIVTDGDVLHYETMVHYAVVNGRIAYDKAEESLLSHIRPLEGPSRFKAAELLEELEKIHPPGEEEEEGEAAEKGDEEKGKGDKKEGGGGGG